MESECPKRKSTRLKEFDYGAEGAYFVTICTGERKRVLSEITQPVVGDGAYDVPQYG